MNVTPAVRVLVVAAMIAATTNTVPSPHAQAEQAWAWSLVSVNRPPAAIHPGTKLVIHVVARNEGAETWTTRGDHPVLLGATGPRDRSSPFASDDPTWMWSEGRRVPMLTPVVPPGGLALFAFTFTAPALESYPADFAEAFAPVAEGAAWMDDDPLVLSTQVRPLPLLPPLPNPPLPPPPGQPCLPEGTPGPDDLVPAGTAWGYARSDVVEVDAVSEPVAVSLDPFGRLVVADAEGAVVRMDPSGTVLASWAVAAPRGVEVTPTGVVLVSDAASAGILMFTLFGTPVGSLGAGTVAAPGGLALLASGSVALADAGNGRVVVLEPSGTTGSVVGDGLLSEPSDVATWAGDLYVADTGNDRVVRFAPDGSVRAVIGGSGDGPGCLSAPTGVAVGPHGMYVADAGNGRIVHYGRTGHPVSHWGAQPTGLTLDGSTVWVAETQPSRLQRFRPSVHAAPPGP